MTNDERIEQMLGLVMDLAAGNLDARLEPVSRTEPLDGVIEGLNMLAEELRIQSTSRMSNQNRNVVCSPK